MNKNITEEELLLRKRARRRLVGAIVLVLVAVIILPMIFDEPKPDTESHEIDIHLSPKDDITAIAPLVVPERDLFVETLPEVIDQMEFTTDTPVDLSTLPQLQDTAEPLIQDLDPVSKKHIPIPGIKPRYEASTRVSPVAIAVPEAVPTVIDKPVSSHSQGEFVVQLGAFSDQTKAQQQQNALMSNGFKAYTETLIINGNVMTRVRIGPFANRAAAQLELDKLRRLGQDGVITQQ